MVEELNPHEARVLGVLIEKAFTTPDQYPLSINAATNGSNQKSNRKPVFNFSEAEVLVALQGLRMKHLAGSSSPAGSRVEKWRHSASEHFAVDDRQLAVIAELLVRGPQTQGELRARASRMSTISNLEVLGQVLAQLMERGFVRRLAPAHGSRAERYAQTFAPRLALDGEEEPGAEPTSASAPRATSLAPPAAALGRASSGASDAELGARVAALEAQVKELRALIVDLAGRLGESIG